jgi:Predicted membrane protein
MSAPQANFRPLVAAGTLLGIGLGGFVDGIVLHQILQVHNMLSAKYPPDTLVNVEINMVWDGLFHAFTWLMTVIGLAMLWRAGQKPEVPWSTRTLIGSLVMGWGVFNLVEGVIDHHILHLHHVIERLGASAADWLFLGVGGVLFLLVGRAIIASGSRDTPASHPSPGTAPGPGGRY